MDELLANFNEGEQARIRLIVSDPFGMDALRPFLIAAAVRERGTDMVSVVAEELGADPSVLLSYISLNFWQSSPVHARYSDYAAQRRVSAQLAGVGTEVLEMWFTKSLSEGAVFGIHDLVSLFVSTMNQLEFNKILGDIRLCYELDRIYRQPMDVSPQAIKQVVQGRAELGRLTNETIAALQALYRDDSRTHAQRYGMAMVRADRITLAEMFLVPLHEVYGSKEALLEKTKKK